MPAPARNDTQGSDAAALQPSIPPTARTVGILLASIAGIALAGLGGALWLSSIPLGQQDPTNWGNAFYVLFARNEPIGLALVLLFTAMTALWVTRGASAVAAPEMLDHKRAIPVLALVTFGVSAIGVWVVFHGYAFTADEFMADFQARLFAAGKIRHEVPEFWRPMLRLIIPTFAIYDPATGTWMSSYLPVYAALRSLFMRIGLEQLTNATMAAGSIICMAALGRRLWPNERWAPGVAAGLLAASPQFLVTSMTGYAMPAHLTLNLLWLWLYSEPNKRQYWFAPFVGVAALGLHQPFVHALFVTPFLFRLLLDRRWKAVVWFAAVYLVGIATWWTWWRHFVPGNAGGGPGTFGVDARTPVVQTMNLLLLTSWLALPVPLLACLGFWRLRGERTLLLDCALSCLLTFGFYVFVRLDQGHGWGYRYMYGALGCLILVAVSGWRALSECTGRDGAITFAIIGIVASMGVQLSVKCVQAESIVRPFAKASAEIRNSAADIVVFDPRPAWYLADLRRNDPLFEQHPIVVMTMSMTETEGRALQQKFARGKVLTRDDLVRLGFDLAPSR
jgi:hypothetical protein